MNMKVDLSTSTENLLFLDYMEREEQKKQLQNLQENQNKIWYCEELPPDDFERDNQKIL